MDGVSKKKRDLKKMLWENVRDIIIAAVAVLILLGCLYAYSGVWPPMVVVESGSMMHGDDSAIGIIDTGDLTLVKKVYTRDDIITYVEARFGNGTYKGYKTYGDYGDVIIYRKNGGSGTPIIHRAIVWIEYNETKDGIYYGDIPDINVYHVSGYTIHDVGYNKITINIDIDGIFRFMANSGKIHGGFLTKGDHNSNIDQDGSLAGGRRSKPVALEWVIGKAEGELPWFGLIKLWLTGHDPVKFPSSSIINLLITLAILVGVPIAVDYAIGYMKKKKKYEDLKESE